MHLPQALPELSLTQGQLLWALGHGQDPAPLLKDQIRYLRQLGIPQTSNKNAPGSGNHIRYDFFDLVEMGIATKALHLRFRPKDIAAVIVSDQERFREKAAEVWRSFPEDILTRDWVKSRNRKRPVLGNLAIVRLHDRRSEQWGKLDFAWIGDEDLNVDLLDPIERFDDGQSRALIPLSVLMLPWVAWALEAPEPRRGPM